MAEDNSEKIVDETWDERSVYEIYQSINFSWILVCYWNKVVKDCSSINDSYVDDEDVWDEWVLENFQYELLQDKKAIKELLLVVEKWIKNLKTKALLHRVILLKSFTQWWKPLDWIQIGHDIYLTANNNPEFTFNHELVHIVDPKVIWDNAEMNRVTEEAIEKHKIWWSKTINTMLRFIKKDHYAPWGYKWDDWMKLSYEDWLLTQKKWSMSLCSSEELEKKYKQYSEVPEWFVTNYSTSGPNELQWEMYAMYLSDKEAFQQMLENNPILDARFEEFKSRFSLFLEF